ncbi:MAG: MmgE/PrpD family protein [Candidatus Tectomicrobia bacterium]|uniref:MmgE/PrpD family protein n=1 Tax=Tectimicrobiota bacterium TaxID=2528274 RepID=A0A937W0W3_UNCTE|nr:MmgE/PrpD family protein [Candidatus Tectomicrobia bacterium]
MTATERLARFVFDLEYAALPHPVRDYARLCVLDTLGIALAGHHEPSTRAARTVAQQMGGTPQATLFVHGNRVPVLQAALVNGTAAFSHNFTDTTLSCVIHAGPVTVPAAFAVGEMVGASGAQVLTAVVAGYEVITRVGNAINAGTARMSHHRKGYHPTATCGVFGAAAIAGKLLGLSVEELVQAFGVAGSFASGLSESLTDGTDVWRAHGGIAAHNGILATLLAQAGLTGPTAVLEGRRGFCTAFTDGQYEAPALVQDLGERYLILDAAFKLHNTAHVWALPLDALGILQAQHGFHAADVEQIVVTFPQNWTAIMDDPSGATYAPANYAQATNNLRYCLAVGLHEGKVYLEQFDESRLRHPGILDTAQRILPRPDAAMGRIFETTDKAPTHIQVTLKSGVSYEQHVDYPRGCPQNPAAPAELEAKFQALVTPVLPPVQVQRAQDCLLTLDAVPHLGDAITLLCA